MCNVLKELHWSHHKAIEENPMNIEYEMHNDWEEECAVLRNENGSKTIVPFKLFPPEAFDYSHRVCQARVERGEDVKPSQAIAPESCGQNTGEKDGVLHVLERILKEQNKGVGVDLNDKDQLRKLQDLLQSTADAMQKAKGIADDRHATAEEGSDQELLPRDGDGKANPAEMRGSSDAKTAVQSKKRKTIPSLS